MNSSVKQVARSTVISSCAVAGMAAWRGLVEGSTGWRPVNATSHIVWGPAAGSQSRFSLRYTGLGLLLNGAACAFWSWLYERRRRASEPRSMVNDALEAMGTSVIAYVIDYHVIPRRFTPGFELSLSPRSFLWIYAALAVGLLISRGLHPFEGKPVHDVMTTG